MNLRALKQHEQDSSGFVEACLTENKVCSIRHTSAGWPAAATSAINRLGQYASSPGAGPLLRRTRRFFLSGDLDYRQYSHKRPGLHE